MTLIGPIAQTIALIATPYLTPSTKHQHTPCQTPTPATTTTPAATATTTTPAPTPAEIPTLDEVQAAAHLYDQAREQPNTAARTKRRAEKVLKTIPDGTYGPVTITRVSSGRQVADLDAIRAIFAAHGLGDLPMKACAPSLTITWAAESPADQPEPALAAA